MNKPPRVLVFGNAGRPAGELYERLRARGLEPTAVEPGDVLRPDVAPQGCDVAVVFADHDHSPAAEPVELVVRQLVQERVATVVCGEREPLRRESGPLVEWVESDIELDELVGKVGTLTRYAPIIKGLERELRNLQRLGEQLNRYFGEIDQEMRLAGRLQRDFLPRQMPSLASVGFEVFYRPASWVSGDMYDVFRIDEHHVGMFVADAMGHGVAAGLLTMFLRQALVSKHVSGSSYTIVSPAEALENLHQCLVRQQLPNSQFVTAAYGVVDTRTLEITIARAGHPYPVHIDGEGTMREVRSDGSLLGLADVPSSFEQRRVALAPGDKVLFYTDGVEEAVVVPDRGLENHAVFTGQMRHWAHLTTAEFVQAVGDYLDCRAGSLHPADDITMLLLEVWADAGEC